MTRAEAIRLLDLNREYLRNTNNIGLKDDIEALDMAISDMTAISKIRAKLNTEYNNTSGDVQTGIAIALGILDRYTKGESQ